jgi:SNF2 family DNA or RNA helicase
VLNHTGIQRPREVSGLLGYDVVLTTYGTLRQDVALLKDVHFDYLILDEAQAVKNADTGSAKAVRLMQGEHRLALTGTPVENHLGELLSLFEFLNPGMLGSLWKPTAAQMRNPSPQTLQLLSRTLRPFILRRTKAQVAKELPPRQVQTLHCELGPVQRRLYDELRDAYRAKLLQGRSTPRRGQFTFQVLEALLRLRQAACHPGLIDREQAQAPSAKLEVLLPQLEEVLSAGHKVLVFSQFTSFLGLLRKQLEERCVRYESLDGRTRDRKARVERFQKDADCRLFLISLKAGGLGLNLTAADYVYLLDPWWNPAVEAQALDRAHRIGQTRTVFGYKLIARDTVEEKVLQLQAQKQRLAEGILGDDSRFVGGLTREDLELLLS